ncbi:transposase-like protein [Colletotrichum musicola]|uniref:Transposase-like protein n=1 Tax=Colletotrichum musicola TaxID=2175873 RepID=A0A8H6J2S9_9PEZI|nr:transposase-like protein [Colletotrichum musicola]
MQFDHDLYTQVSWSKSSQKKAIDQIFKAKRATVREGIHRGLTKVHISFDLWTSPNGHAITALHAHYLDHNKQQSQQLIALRIQLGAHSGDNLALTLESVIRQWCLTSRLGTIVSDNASNNDTCVRSLFGSLYPHFTGHDILHRRLRCYGHILNLVGKAFLHGVDQEAFEQESDNLLNNNRIREDLEFWRTRGSVGKLRNIVKFIRSSPQRSQTFQELSKESEDDEGFTIFEESPRELQLMLSNETRWNSIYLIINRAILKRQQIDGFIRHNQLERSVDNRIPIEDILNNDEWLLLVELKDILEPLYLQTMRCQGWGKGDGHGRLWEIMAGIEYLIDKLEDWKRLFSDPTEEEIDLTASQFSRQPSRQPSRSTRSRASRSTRLAPGPPSQSSSQPPNLESLPSFVVSEYLPRNRLDRFNSLQEDSRAYFRLSVLNAWQVLNKYYTKLRESPLFAASIILHPGRGLRWLEKRWTDESQLVWLRDAKNRLHSYWEKWYALATTTERTPSPSRGDFAMISAAIPEENSEYREWLNSRAIEVSADDSSELDQYYRLVIPQPVNDPIQWWLDHQQAFPTLSKLALDVFAIPAMATDCERTFSLAKLTLTSQRLAMSPSTLEEVQCLKSWFRGAVITLGGYNFTKKS